MFDLFRLRDEAEFRDLTGETAIEAQMPEGLREARDFPHVDLWKPPGPVANAFFFCDADVIGIRGPVGSGKITAHLRSRVRRAQMMPLLDRRYPALQGHHRPGNLLSPAVVHHHSELVGGDAQETGPLGGRAR